MAGHDHHRRAVRIFNVARIRDLEVLDRPFDRDPDFNADEYLGGIFEVSDTREQHKVRIQFFDIAARRAEARRSGSTTELLT